MSTPFEDQPPFRLGFVVIQNDDAPDELAIYTTDETAQNEWIVASEDAFVSLDDMQ
ncbi:hypothetical protein AArcMg_1409 [Natrarchaeobaculum sulfurireducens]|uniref:DUF7511 domain-containing protein n=1 Tax=Natrarchaeobaculum sulfurireducens TaxID=2044521 RepID=A0A346PG78_9EURY|nr:hypothetical protein AArc1_2207 [Natrarchaeobaculum sulfurireducens]AXR81424.1 hypothetical protein AArcMg_1409 [Natrarchaeobaculum sulfurireducens]